MKRLLGAVVVLAFFAAPAAAQIVGSAHDMTTYFGTATASAQVCIYCHAPHNAFVGTIPLWNHTVAAGPFTMYPDANLQGTVAATPNGRTLYCLSCHDGVTNVDAFGGAAGTETIGGPTIGAPGAHIMGTDLSDDHPVSVTINTSAPDFNTPVDTKIYQQGVDFYVECSSCHDPHSIVLASFLRETPAASAICQDCHNK